MIREILRREQYLTYRVDEGLSMVPTSSIDRLSLVGVREDGRDQIDALISGNGASNQAFHAPEISLRPPGCSGRNLTITRAETYGSFGIPVAQTSNDVSRDGDLSLGDLAPVLG